MVLTQDTDDLGADLRGADGLVECVAVDVEVCGLGVCRDAHLIVTEVGDGVPAPVVHLDHAGRGPWGCLTVDDEGHVRRRVGVLGQAGDANNVPHPGLAGHLHTHMGRQDWAGGEGMGGRERQRDEYDLISYTSKVGYVFVWL